MQRTRTPGRVPLLAIVLTGSLLLGACGEAPSPAPAGNKADSSDTPDSVDMDSNIPVDTTTTPDTIAPVDSGSGSACPGCTGCTCDNNDDCDSTMCMEGSSGKQCAQSCVDTCEEGFSCAQVPKGSDVVLVCVSNWSRLCSPCEETKDCNYAGVTNARCVDAGAAGNYCGAGCASDNDCPTGHACKSTKDVDGNATKQCLPIDTAGKLSACSCSKNAVALALKTPCS